jgi:hypothetical protein
MVEALGVAPPTRASEVAMAGCCCCRATGDTFDLRRLMIASA